MNKPFLYAYLITLSFATFNILSMKPKEDLLLWVPKVKPAIYLNLQLEGGASVITSLTQHGDNQALLDYFFDEDEHTNKALGEPFLKFCAQTEDDRKLLKTALAFAESNGKVKVGLKREHEDAAGIHTAQFIASILYMYPKAFQVKIIPEKTKAQKVKQNIL